MRAPTGVTGHLHRGRTDEPRCSPSTRLPMASASFPWAYWPVPQPLLPAVRVLLRALHASPAHSGFFPFLSKTGRQLRAHSRARTRGEEKANERINDNLDVNLNVNEQER